MHLRLLLAFLLLSGCVTSGTFADDDDAASGDDDDAVSDDDDATNPDPSTWPEELEIDGRIARVKWPAGYDGGLLPLIIQLHGYTGSGSWQWQWPDLAAHIDATGILLVTGEGTVDQSGDRFWNATDACCDLYGSNVDDVGWLTSVLDALVETFPVDTDRVYFTGLSNGGFMSYRMACELSDRVAAIASVAGMDFDDDDACVPDQPVSVLHVHGTDDETVPYWGSDEFWFSIPSAPESAERWAARAGCDLEAVSEDPAADYVENIAGAETSRKAWRTGCTDGRGAALWTMEDAPHVPAFNEQMGRDLLDWLLARSL